MWDAELLCQFIDSEIFPDRRIIQLRISAALPEKFTPADGLDWLKKEHISIGNLDLWVQQNTLLSQGFNTATPAPVEAVGAFGGVEPNKSGPLPLTTGDIAFCFAGLRCKTEKEWKDLIGKGRNWVERCLIQPGTRGHGGAPKLWNPVCIGAALVRDGHAKPNSVRAKFQTVHLLQPWLETWKTYEADNFATQ